MFQFFLYLEIGSESTKFGEASAPEESDTKNGRNGTNPMHQ